MNAAELVFAALTNGSDGLRAHHNKVPRKGDAGHVFPLLTITTVSETAETDLRGDSSLRRRVVQIDAWSKTRKGADDLAELARAKMTAASTFKIGSPEKSGAPEYDDEADLFRASYDYPIWYLAT